MKSLEQITARFILRPKDNKIKSLRVYLGGIYELSRMCLLLDKVKARLQPFRE